ncbi:MAG: siderophore-interacting protein [Rhodospirillales bacterium]|nr:siderophore-interacting protein [Rhodospirillales bacterium]
MRLITVVAMASILSIPAPAPAQEWIEFASQEDRFTCNFPGQPEVTETTWVSEFGAELPARVYAAESGPSRYTVTVADYSHAERILTERTQDCPPGAERCSGGGLTGEGYWRHDVLGAMLFATWRFLQRDGEATHLGYNTVDRVEGHQLHLTNPDESRTFVSIYMHENKLYVLEGTVPRGYPEPALFQQSLGWLDENGAGLRYESTYSNGFPAPPRVPAVF